MKIAGKEKFLKQLGALPAAMRAEVRKALEASAEEATDLMRRFVPVEKGVLRSTIGYSFRGAPESSGFITKAADVATAVKGEAGLAVTMFAGGHATTKEVREGAGEQAFDYALAVEYGTKGRRQSAQPFFWPAYRLARKRAKSRLARAVRAGAKKAFAK